MSLIHISYNIGVKKGVIEKWLPTDDKVEWLIATDGSGKVMSSSNWWTFCGEGLNLKGCFLESGFGYFGAESAYPPCKTTAFESWSLLLSTTLVPELMPVK